MRAWSQVQVKNPEHPRGAPAGPNGEVRGQAGTVYKATADDATEVEVTFDLPNEKGERIELVKVADLVVLGV